MTHHRNHERTMPLHHRLIAPLTALLLAACGGGGGDDEQALAPCEAEQAAVVAQRGQPQRVDKHDGFVGYTYWTQGFSATFNWDTSGRCTVRTNTFPPMSCNLELPTCNPQ